MFRFALPFFTAFFLAACAAQPASTPPDPLKGAVMRGDTEAVAALIKGGMDPNRLVEGLGPLHRAQFYARRRSNLNKYLEMTELLVSLGADPNLMAQPPSISSTPLSVVRHPEQVETLVALGADPNVPGEENATVLHLTDEPAIARALLENGADPEARMVDGSTPLDFTIGQLAQFRHIFETSWSNERGKPGLIEARKEQLEKLRAKIEVLGHEVPTDREILTNYPQFAKYIPESAIRQAYQQGGSAGATANGSGLIRNNTGRYMNPWTSDGVLAEWVDKAINADIGSAAGSAVGAAAGAYAGKKALENIPGGGMLGGFLGGSAGSKAGAAVGRDAAIAASGGEAYIRQTSDQSFLTLEDMARYLRANHASSPNYQAAVKAANAVYPGLLEAMGGL